MIVLKIETFSSVYWSFIDDWGWSIVGHLKNVRHVAADIVVQIVEVS